MIRKYFMTVLMTVAVGEYAMAQFSIDPKLMAETELSAEWMKSNLNLCDDQFSAVADIIMRYDIRFDSINRSHVDRFVKFQRTYLLKQARDNELKFILSEKQFLLYQRKSTRKKVSETL